MTAKRPKVGIYKTDLESGKYLAGAVFNLYTADDIYDADGSLVFAAGELVATSPETNADGHHLLRSAIFPSAVSSTAAAPTRTLPPTAASISSRKSVAPLGYYVNEEPMEVTFTYDGRGCAVFWKAPAPTNLPKCGSASAI